VAQKYGGIYDSHIRDESSYSVGLLAAVEEAIAIGDATGIPVHISHIKALGTDVWGQSKAVIDLVEAAREQGVMVTANQYPYLASKTSFRATMIPRWAEEGGRKAFRKRLESREVRPRLLLEVKDNIRKRGGGEALVFSETNNPALDGFSLKDFAEARLLPEPEAVLVLLNEQDNVSVISYNMKEDDLKNFMLQPWVVTGSDASSGHPRKFGSFARKIGHYAQELGWMEMQTAIYQSSGHTAEIFGIPDRGFIRTGHYADLVLFDPEKFTEKATFDQPYEEAYGVDHLFINGEKIIAQGSFTGKLAGKILRKEIQAE
jgi:N-acyl-D-aspartate/D-glutamate deacylase